MKLTKKEKKAISALKRVAAVWPDSLWLFAAEGGLCVMKKNEKGERVMKPNEAYEGREAEDFAGFDPDCIVDTINIENEGGAW